MRTLAILLLIVISSSLCAQTELQTMMIFDSPVIGTAYNGSFFNRVSGDGDLNGDGYSDIVIAGCPLDGESWERTLYIYLGSAQPDSDADYSIERPETIESNGTFGYRVAYDGDMDGDGIGDLVVSDYRAGEIGQGLVHIYYGGDQLSTEPDITLDGFDYASDSWGLNFGGSIDISGDLNGDGYHDLVVGSYGPSGDFNGQVDVFFGGPIFDAVVDWHRQGCLMEMFGEKLAVGDINTDGFCDLFVSAFDRSAFSIYLGGPEIDPQPSYAFSMEYMDIGQATMKGDFNNDGYVDLAFSGGIGIVSMMFGGVDFSNPLFALPIQYHNANISSFYYATVYDHDYLTVSMPIDSTFYLFKYDPEDTLSIAYVFDGINYNPNAWGEQGFFIGDYNGDGHGDMLLSTRVDGGPWRFRILTPEYVSVDDKTVTPESIVMNCFPNPSRFGSTVSFNLSHPAQADVTIYNIRGQRVRNLASKRFFTTGEHRFYWDGKDFKGLPCASGIYFIRINTSSSNQIHKIIILR